MHGRTLMLLPALWLAACAPDDPRPGGVGPAQGGPNTMPGGTISGGGLQDGGTSGASDAGRVSDAACATAEALANRPPVDIVITIDQSGSMADDIANVKANVNALSGFLESSGLDYRVVMIATPGSGSFEVCVAPPLGTGEPACASKPPRLRVVDRNVQSHDSLRILLDTFDAPAGSGVAWADFLRKDAFKVFVPITDDDSRGPGMPDASSFDALLLAKPGGQFGTASARRYVFHPICGAAAYPSEGVCGSNAVNNGPTYLELAKLTGGRWFPICRTDFGPVFTEMAKAIATSLACELTVPSPPPGETLDHDQVNVLYTHGSGTVTETIYRDDTRPCAAGADGWQYSADKKQILLCGGACKRVQADLGARLTVEFGCESRFRPPPA